MQQLTSHKLLLLDVLVSWAAHVHGLDMETARDVLTDKVHCLSTVFVVPIIGVVADLAPKLCRLLSAARQLF